VLTCCLLESVGEVVFIKHSVARRGLRHEQLLRLGKTCHGVYVFFRHTAVFETFENGVAVVFTHNYGHVAFRCRIEAEVAVAVVLLTAEFNHARCQQKTPALCHGRKNVERHRRANGIAVVGIVDYSETAGYALYAQTVLHLLYFLNGISDFLVAHTESLRHGHGSGEIRYIAFSHKTRAQAQFFAIGHAHHCEAGAGGRIFNITRHIIGPVGTGNGIAYARNVVYSALGDFIEIVVDYRKATDRQRVDKFELCGLHIVYGLERFEMLRAYSGDYASPRMHEGDKA